jgi:hypothetical protein
MADKQIFQKAPALAFAALIAGNVHCVRPVAGASVRYRADCHRLLALGAGGSPFLPLSVTARVSGSSRCQGAIGAGAAGGLLLCGRYRRLAYRHLQDQAGQCDAACQLRQLLLAIYGIFLARKLPPPMQGIAILLAFAGAALLMGQSFEISPEHFRRRLAEPARWAVLHLLSAGDDPCARKHRELVVAGWRAGSAAMFLCLSHGWQANRSCPATGRR